MLIISRPLTFLNGPREQIGKIFSLDEGIIIYFNGSIIDNHIKRPFFGFDIDIPASFKEYILLSVPSNNFRPSSKLPIPSQVSKKTVSGFSPHKMRFFHVMILYVHGFGTFTPQHVLVFSTYEPELTKSGQPRITLCFLDISINC